MTSSAKGGPKVVRNIVAVAPSRLATSTAIHVGSTEDEVRTAYGPFLDRESTQRGKVIVAGSIYGGSMAERDFPRRRRGIGGGFSAPPVTRLGDGQQAGARTNERSSSAICRTGARRLRAERLGVTYLRASL